ncbi:hypothetical protein ZWY2020_028808 [Hordeum vulgare]|nr:hypothetical protein ZWY2020_028808 [Hordeum vulgare]
MAGSKGSSCTVNGCDAKVMSDERGQDILPCEWDFKICAECFGDAVTTIVDQGDVPCSATETREREASSAPRAARERPKSASLARRSAPWRMLPDLTSRWKMGGRAACGYAMAAAVPAATPSRARHGSVSPSPWRWWGRVPLGMSS